MVAVTRPVVKVGLVAPFEGRDRATGYEALYAAKLAIFEHNADVKASARVELLALDSGANADLIFRQARSLAVDPDVRIAAVISPASSELQVRTTYASLAVPLIVIDPVSLGAAPEPAFVERYRAVSGGAAPGALAVRLYTALSAALVSLTPAAR